MKGRVILLGYFNAHSSDRNLHCSEMRDAACLVALIEEYDLIINNNPEQATRPT